jgi:hypothetical protein
MVQFHVTAMTTYRNRHEAKIAALLALAVAAVVLLDAVGIVLAIFLGMVIADSLIPLPGAGWSQADARFNRLAARRRRAQRLRRLRGLPPERLDVLDDSAGQLSIAPRQALGIEPIAIDSITATVEATKASVFDGRFRPDRSERQRWNRLWMAQSHGATLPPISVYRVGGRHVVSDGHHRVSIARDLGWAAIDAEVIVLGPVDTGRPRGA